MKKIILPFCLLLLTTVYVQAAPPVNEKVLKAFAESYTNPGEVKWYEYDTYYEAVFKQQDIRVTARYEFNGNLVSTLRYYSGEELHPFILGKLRSKYGDKSIHGVTEKVTENDIEYTIILEDDKQWTYVQSTGLGNMHVAQKLKKG